MNRARKRLDDTVSEILSSCLHPKNRRELEWAAELNGMEFEQLVAAAVAGGIEERFVVRPKRLEERPMEWRSDHKKRPGSKARRRGDF